MKNRLFQILLVLLWSEIISAQSGSLDSTFGNAGVLFCEKDFPLSLSSGPIAPEYRSVTAMDAENRVLVCYSAENNSGLVLTRFLPDGSPDPGFGSGGVATLDAGAPLHCGFLLHQEDGKILAAGIVRHDTVGVNLQDFFIARLLPDGSPDPGFGTQGKVVIDLGMVEYTQGLALQTDGKVLLSGSTGYYNWVIGHTDVVLLRLLPDGSPDLAFGDTGKVLTNLSWVDWDADEGGPIAVQEDGRIVVAAKNGPGYNYEGHFVLMCYEASGVLDSTFGTNGVSIEMNTPVPVSTDIVLKGDQTILIAGKGGDVFSGGLFLTLRRYSPDGGIDSSFATNGIYRSDMKDYGRIFTSVQIQSDERILAAGQDSDQVVLMRLTPNGQPDPDFGVQGRVLTPLPDLAIYHSRLFQVPAGKITLICAGSDYYVDSVDRVLLLRYLTDFNDATHDPSAFDANKVRIAPNPARDQITLFAEDVRLGWLSLYRADGTLIFREKTEGRIQQEFSVAELPAGTYFWKWMPVSTGKAATGKVMVVH